MLGLADPICVRAWRPVEVLQCQVRQIQEFEDRNRSTRAPGFLMILAKPIFPTFRFRVLILLTGPRALGLTLAALRRVWIMVVSLSLLKHHCAVRPLKRVLLSSTPFGGSCPLQAGFKFFWGADSSRFLCSPGVLVGADCVGLLAVLGGLLHCVHDLAVLLRERHDPEKGNEII